MTSKLQINERSQTPVCFMNKYKKFLILFGIVFLIIAFFLYSKLTAKGNRILQCEKKSKNTDFSEGEIIKPRDLNSGEFKIYVCASYEPLTCIISNVIVSAYKEGGTDIKDKRIFVYSFPKDIPVETETYFYPIKVKNMEELKNYFLKTNSFYRSVGEHQVPGSVGVGEQRVKGESKH